MPTKGTTTRQVRVDPDLWTAVGQALADAGEVDRSAAIRLFFRWIERDATGAVAAARAGAQQQRTDA
jgi:hypothetical protein